MVSLKSILQAFVAAIIYAVIPSAAQLLPFGPYLDDRDNITEPRSVYLSRPDLWVPAVNVSISDPAAFAPGYVFFAGFLIQQSAPYIYDKSGNLVWSGYNHAGGGIFTNFHVCQFRGQDHLCFFQGVFPATYGCGVGVIMNNRYEVVHVVTTGNDAPFQDLHEFNMVEGGQSALLSIYTLMRHDLSDYNITTGQGWIQAGAFQEVNTTDGSVLFSWSSIDHIPVNHTQIGINTTEFWGDGLSSKTAFDYFHINSIDKSSRSNTYLVSARHTSSIYQINGTDGSIEWTMSARNTYSDFECLNFNFSFQHHARYMSENETHVIISLFDNASSGLDSSSEYSRGMMISLHLPSRTAALLTAYSAPVEGGILSVSQGSMQHLHNGNAFIGYGNAPAFSEFMEDGTPVLFGQFGSDDIIHNFDVAVHNYRTFTFNWTATPITKPALYAYARNTSGEAPTALFVSWNGATEVSEWAFYGAKASSGPWTLLGTIEKDGFETGCLIKGFQSFVLAEAVAKDGGRLRNSSVKATYVPPPKVAKFCNDIQCPDATGYRTLDTGLYTTMNDDDLGYRRQKVFSTTKDKEY